VLLIGGAFLWLARLDKMRDKEHYRTGKQHAHIVQRKLGNKVSIVVFTFQVIYQYAGIVTGYESYFHYPEPANGAVSYMSMFGLEVLNFSPPECVNYSANYYTKLTIVTLAPITVIALGWLAVRAHNFYTGAGNKSNMKFWANSLLFLEFVLSGVSTIVCKTFVCQHFDGQGEVLVAQPTLSCHNHYQNRYFWEWYACFMVLIYPVGVPLLFFVMLHLQREKIIRVMLVQKALEDGMVPEYDKTMSKKEIAHTKALFEVLQASGEKIEDITIKTIAHADSMRRRMEAEGEQKRPALPRNVSDRRQNLMHLVSQFKSSQTLEDDEGLAISPLLLAMQQYFEKYEGRMYWYGAYLMSVRLFETSMLVFFKKRTTKTTIATAVA
jgi:hypothetical protein